MDAPSAHPWDTARRDAAGPFQVPGCPELRSSALRGERVPGPGLGWAKRAGLRGRFPREVSPGLASTGQLAAELDSSERQADARGSPGWRGQSEDCESRKEVD